MSGGGPARSSLGPARGTHAPGGPDGTRSSPLVFSACGRPLLRLTQSIELYGRVSGDPMQTTRGHTRVTLVSRVIRGGPRVTPAASRIHLSGGGSLPMCLEPATPSTPFGSCRPKFRQTVRSSDQSQTQKLADWRRFRASAPDRDVGTWRQECRKMPEEADPQTDPSYRTSQHFGSASFAPCIPSGGLATTQMPHRVVVLQLSAAAHQPVRSGARVMVILSPDEATS